MKFEDVLAKYTGKLITKTKLEDEALSLTFEDGSKVSLVDDGQSCCERRYITCDDDVQGLVGGKLVGIVKKEHKVTATRYDGDREILFVEVQTDKGFITLCTHNEHNGYYGGFWLKLVEER